LQEQIDSQNETISNTIEKAKEQFGKEFEYITENITKDSEQHMNIIKQSIHNLEKEYAKITNLKKSTKEVGAEGEEFIIQYIQKCFPNWNVVDTHGESECGDFHTHILNSSGLEEGWILNEVKTHKGSIRTAEIKKFYRDIKKHKPPMAIFFSLYSNIVGKKNGEYEKLDNTHIYFISHVMNNPSSIEIVHRSIITMYTQYSKFDNNEQIEKDEKTELQQINDKLVNQKKEYHECIQYMLNKDNIFISQCRKEIQMFKSFIKIKQNNIKETEDNIQRYMKKNFQNSYKNNDIHTAKEFPFYCKKCSYLCKSQKQIVYHLGTKKHNSL